ncbi:hypothetical protein ED92_40185 [Amycolatopsis sp. MJM2582]|uniref:flavin reductase family protein n=1 Tax=Amycolatopsis sp. MJM2582 TaxID=1427749 RepID=UPI0005056266|nr:flavin reductase family protein [Amycolatopsis sp. MJM2582]KFZ76907.1 hypothetical protein ED92_40185 [Amycolatopsis sp. MJM2582]
MPIDENEFRTLFAAVPATVAVITAVDLRGRPHGLTSTTICALAKDPPLLAVSVDERSNTLRAIREAGGFAVNFLAGGRDLLAGAFATKSPDKFAGLRIRPSAAGRGAPILVDDCFAHAECVVWQEVKAGDHALVLGRIEATARYPGKPLLYHDRGFLTATTSTLGVH